MYSRASSCLSLISKYSSCVSGMSPCSNATCRAWLIGYYFDSRYDPPTPYTPTLSHSIPFHYLNPLLHIFQVASCLSHTISIRLLSPTDGPSTGTFMQSEYLAGVQTDDPLTEVCAALMAQVGKIKRTGMGWEDKVEFLEFYKRSRK